VLALLTEYGSSDSTSSEAAELDGGTKVKNVYASLANGTLVVFAPKSSTARRHSHADVTLVSKEEDESLTRESHKWSNIQVVNLGQSGMPAKSMVLVRENKELWVGCGNKIVIVDTSTQVILDEIAVYQTQRTHVRIMVTDGGHVWSADRRSTKILQWEVNTRQLTHIFDCDVDSPVGEVLCSRVTEPRSKGGSLSRHRAISDPSGSFGAPSYTEAMFKEAMAREGNEQGHKTDSMCKDHSLSRGTASSSRNLLEDSDDEDLASSVKTVSPPVTIPGSQGKIFSDKALKKDLPSRFRSPSAETDSGASIDSGVSSFRSTCTTRSNATSTITRATSSAARVPVEDLRDGEVAALETVNVFVSEGTVALDVSQNVAKEIQSQKERTTKDQTSDDSSTILSEKSKEGVSDTADTEKEGVSGTADTEKEGVGVTADSENNSTASELVDHSNNQDDGGEGDLMKPSDGNVKELDENKDLEKKEADFELVDREETRQAFVEGTRKQAQSDGATTKHCASMATLQMRFNSSSRAPSLMSSQKRKSQRRKTLEDDNKSPPTTTKPWARRPRLRILAGSINRVTALLLVNGTLWVGRGVGDVLTLNVNSTNNDLPLGHVFAQLESDNLLGYANGQVDEIVNSGTNKIVCLRRLEPARGSLTYEDRCTERYQLIVWEAWGDAEFRRFKDRLDKFNPLVE